MLVFDTSSIIYGWDNYPIAQFPGLWKWIASQVKLREIALPDIALQELKNKSLECAIWLKNNHLHVIKTNNAILQKAQYIKNLLNITGDKYHPKGVGENDLIIIATASEYATCLVSDENKQLATPDKLEKMKIPAVCAMAEINVECFNFIEYIKRTGEIFG